MSSPNSERSFEPDDVVVAEIRGTRLAGGPPVDYLLVTAYIEGLLQGPDQEKVRTLIGTYQTWSKAYWEFYSCRDMENPCDDTSLGSPAEAIEQRRRDELHPRRLLDIAEKAGLSEDEVVERIKTCIPEFERKQWHALTQPGSILGARVLFSIHKALGVPMTALSGYGDAGSSMALGDSLGAPHGKTETKAPEDPADDGEREVRDFLTKTVADELLHNFACGDEALDRWLVGYAAKASRYHGLLARVIADSCLRKNHEGVREHVDRLAEAAGDVEERQMVALLRQGSQRRHVFEHKEAVQLLQRARNLAREHSNHLILINCFYELARLATSKPGLADASAEEFIHAAREVQSTHRPSRIDLELRIRYAEVQRLFNARQMDEVLDETKAVLDDERFEKFENVLDYIRSTRGTALRRKGTEDARREAQDIYQRAFSHKRPKYYAGMVSYLEGDLYVDRMIEAYQKGDLLAVKRHHAAAIERCLLGWQLLDETGDVAAQQKAASRLQWLQHLELPAPEGHPERTFALREFDFAHYFLGAPDLNRAGAYPAGVPIQASDEVLQRLIEKYFRGLWVAGSSDAAPLLTADYVDANLGYVVSCAVGDQLLVRLYDKVQEKGLRPVRGAFALRKFNTEILRTLAEFRGLEGEDFRASCRPMFEDLQNSVDVATPLPRVATIDSIVIMPPNRNEGWALGLEWLRTRDPKTGKLGPNLLEVTNSQLVYGVSGNPAKGMMVSVSDAEFRLLASTQRVSGKIIHSVADTGFGDRVEAFDVVDASIEQPVPR